LTRFWFGFGFFFKKKISVWLFFFYKNQIESKMIISTVKVLRLSSSKVKLRLSSSKVKRNTPCCCFGTAPTSQFTQSQTKSQYITLSVSFNNIIISH
jgi:hypothetical protein